MYYLFAWFSALGLASLVFFCLLARYRNEWIDSVERLWTELSHTRSIFEKFKDTEKSHLVPLSERLCKLESGLGLVLSRLEKLENTPEKRSNDAANTAVNEILKWSW